MIALLFLLIDGLKTGLKLLHGQAEANLLFILCSSKRKERTIDFIIYVGRHLIRYGGRHIQINKGNPLFARESKGNPPTGLIFAEALLLTFLLHNCVIFLVNLFVKLKLKSSFIFSCFILDILSSASSFEHFTYLAFIIDKFSHYL